MALSRFNLSWVKFLKLTPIEFFLALRDQEEFEISKIRPVCESIRTSTWYLLNVQIKKKIKEPQKLFTLPWDVLISGKEPQTLQEMKNVMRSIVSSTKNRKKEKK